MSIAEIEPGVIYKAVMGYPNEIVDGNGFYPEYIATVLEADFKIKGLLEAIESTFSQVKWRVGQLTDRRVGEPKICPYLDLCVVTDDNYFELRYFPSVPAELSFSKLYLNTDYDLFDSGPSYNQTIEYCNVEDNIIYFKLEYDQNRPNNKIVLGISLTDGSHAWFKKKPYQNKQKLPLFPQL